MQLAMAIRDRMLFYDTIIAYYFGYSKYCTSDWLMCNTVYSVYAVYIVCSVSVLCLCCMSIVSIYTTCPGTCMAALFYFIFTLVNKILTYFLRLITNLSKHLCQRKSLIDRITLQHYTAPPVLLKKHFQDQESTENYIIIYI